MTETAAGPKQADDPFAFWREAMSNVPTRVSSFAVEEAEEPAIKPKNWTCGPGGVNANKRKANRDRSIERALKSAKRFLDQINDENKENIDPLRKHRARSRSVLKSGVPKRSKS